MFDHLRLWRRNLTFLLVWYMKNFMAEGQVLRVIGEEQEKFTTLSTDALNTLAEIEYDIFVDEVQKNENMREAQFQQMKELFAILGAPPELAMPLLIELSSLPQSKKQELTSQIQWFQQYQQQQAELAKEQKLQQQVEDSLRKKAMREAAEGTQGGEGMKQVEDDIAREFEQRLERESVGKSPLEQEDLRAAYTRASEAAQRNARLLLNGIGAKA